MKGLYKMSIDCGRQGELNGIFIAEKEYVEYLITHNIEVHFGEVLGKHSDIAGILDSSDIKFITDKEDVIEVIEKYGLESGYDPFYQTLGYETEDVPENGVDWHDCTVQEYIDFQLFGLIPELYKEEYEEWCKKKGGEE